MRETQSPSLFSFVIPVLALLVSASFVLFPSLRTYAILKNAPRTSSKSAGQGDAYIILGGSYGIQIPEKNLPRAVVEMTALGQRGPIASLNAPGYLVYGLGSAATGHSAHSFPQSIGPFLWPVAVIPICAIPAWWFVGRGIDGLLRRRKLRLGDMIASSVLLLGSATISAGLRFGLSWEERAADEMSSWFIAGFAWWAGLFAISLVVWLFQRTQAYRLKLTTDN